MELIMMENYIMRDIYHPINFNLLRNNLEIIKFKMIFQVISTYINLEN